MVDLNIAASELLERAREADHGRAAQLAAHDGVLRQLVLALTAGTALAEHNAPPAASLQVLAGRVRLEYAADSSIEDSELAAGELALIGHERHGLQALDDSVVLLTTVTGLPGEGSSGSAGPRG